MNTSPSAPARRWLQRVGFTVVLLVLAAACGDSPTTPAVPSLDLSPSFTVAPAQVCGTPTVVTLWAGQNMNAGTVTVSNDEDNLYVTYETASGWSLSATHTAVVTDPSDFPTNKAGNPKLGQFPYAGSHAAGTTAYTVAVALADLGIGSGDAVYVAAQADVAGPNGDEGAWGEGNRFVTRGSWAMYFSATVQECAFDVLVMSNNASNNNHVVAELQSRMPGANVSSMVVYWYTPTAAELAQYDVILLYENGVFYNARNVGNAVAAYAQSGGSVVLGTFYWQNRSDAWWGQTYGHNWGALEGIDPFTTCCSSSGGSEYNADHLGTVVAHPLTAGVSSLSVSSYHGGVAAKAGTEVVAWWSDGVPFIGYATLGGGQRMVGVSVFPAHNQYGGVSGDFWQVWTNAVTWAAATSSPSASAAVANIDLTLGDRMPRASDFNVGLAAPSSSAEMEGPPSGTAGSGS